MSISSDYLDLDSVASEELLKPLLSTIDKNDMVVAACTVDVYFQTHHTNWLWQESVKSDCVTREVLLFEEILIARQKQPPVQPIVDIARKLAPIVSLTNPEKELPLISEICSLIRKDVKTSNEILYAFVLASLRGTTEPETLQKLKSLSREQFQELWNATQQTIQNSSDLELFKHIQSLFPHLVFVIKMVLNQNVETPQEIKDKEILKISRCYEEAIKAVCDRPEPKDLTRILITVVLVNRYKLDKATIGYYDISNQKPGIWTWEK